MRYHTSSFLFAAIATASLAAAPARAEDEHRELGAHVHGHGTLNIAVEGNVVSMELEVPGMDIVGFEHEASSDEQKAAVDKAKGELAKPLTLFQLPAAAGCKVAKADVAVEAEHEHEDHDEHHADADHDDEDHDEHAGHRAFHVAYELDCAKPSNLASITFDYFKQFAGAQSLTVNVITAKAQNSYEVGRDKPELDLGGMM